MRRLRHGRAGRPGPRLALLAGILLAAPAPAEEPAGAPGAPTGAPAPVALDRLLKIPDSHTVSVPSRGGSTRAEWRSRFVTVKEDLAEERAGLQEAQAELAKSAGEVDPWKVGPSIPGVDTSAADSPLDYQLRTRIRNHRNEIRRLERDLRELEVEANLASVPADWRE